MKYVMLTEDNTVREIIPEFDPALPNFTIDQRYPTSIVEKLIPVEDSVIVAQQYLYENGAFIAPPVPEEEEQEEVE